MAIKVEEIEDQSLPGGACYAFLERKTETFCIYYVSGSSQIFCNTHGVSLKALMMNQASLRSFDPPKMSGNTGNYQHLGSCKSVY